MAIIFYLIVFIFGLVIGSFLNCLIYRLARPNFSWKNLGGLKDRSYCPYCKHILIWQDLIPVFSFLFLKGKCRYCHKKISIQYPLVEIATGFLFVLIFNFQLQPYGESLTSFNPTIFNEFSIFNFQVLLTTFYLFIISCFLIVIFVYDLRHFIIPDKIIYPAIIIALIFNFFTLGGPAVSWQFSILSAFGAAVFFLIIVLISQGRWMGIGDIKLAFFMGLLLGFPNILVALFLSFLIGAIIGVGLILAKKKTLKSEVPFGPFLVIGTFVALFWGQKIIQWYLDIFI